MKNDLPSIEEQKTSLNAQVKAATRRHLRSKSWPEKIESVERMNAATKIARSHEKGPGKELQRRDRLIFFLCLCSTDGLPRL